MGTTKEKLLPCGCHDHDLGVATAVVQRARST